MSKWDRLPFCYVKKYKQHSTSYKQRNLQLSIYPDDFIVLQLYLDLYPHCTYVKQIVCHEAKRAKIVNAESVEPDKV